MVKDRFDPTPHEPTLEEKRATEAGHLMKSASRIMGNPSDTSILRNELISIESAAKALRESLPAPEQGTLPKKYPNFNPEAEKGD